MTKRIRSVALPGTGLGKLWRGVAIGGLITGIVWASGGLIPLNPFELDGNTTKDTSLDDWQNVNTTGGNSAAHTGVAQDFSNFSGGASVTDQSTFIQGAKDTDDVNAWHSGPGGIPPKDDIVNAYAAAYNVSGHLIINFGADRFANNGSAQLGFWFFQGAVTPPTAGTKGLFTGTHKSGDILALVNFTQGGGVPDIQIYQWVGGKNPLQQINASVGKCGTSGATDACAITNDQTPVDLYWPSHFKAPVVPDGKACDGASTGACAPLVSFFEGSIDVTTLLGTTPCFTSFMTETRSSTSLSASLEDYVLHTINICGLTISKTCGTASAVGGTEINYPVSGVVTNVGIGPLYNVSVFDTPTSPAGSTRPAILVHNNTAGSPNFNSSTLGSGETGTWSDSTTTSAAPVSDSALAQAGLTASVTPTGDSNQTGTLTSTTPATATCTASFETLLQVTKFCGVPAGPQNNPPAVPGVTVTSNNNVVGIQVNYNGTVCNNGVSEVTSVTLLDTPKAGPPETITIGTLPACTSFNANGCNENDGLNCKTYSSKYVPTDIDAVITGTGPVSTGPGRYSWSDLIVIKTASATIGGLCKIGDPAPCPQYSTPPAGTNGTYGFGTATCPICEGSGECTAP